MNKQDKIDELVNKYGGKFPRYAEAKQDDDVGGYTIGSSDLRDITYRSEIISAEEFQQRARELGYGVEAVESEGWCDYTNQKALRLPPVGAKCQVKIDKIFSECTVIHHANNHLSIIAAFKSPKVKDSDVGYLGWSDNFRPLDWNCKAEAERKRVVDAAYQAIGASGTNSYAALEAAHEAGFLRMPEDK